MNTETNYTYEPTVLISDISPSPITEGGHKMMKLNPHHLNPDQQMEDLQAKLNALQTLQSEMDLPEGGETEVIFPTLIKAVTVQIELLKEAYPEGHRIYTPPEENLLYPMEVYMSVTRRIVRMAADYLQAGMTEGDREAALELFNDYLASIMRPELAPSWDETQETL